MIEIASKDIDFSFKSNMKGVGTYKKKLRFIPRTPRLEIDLINVKSALTGGVKPYKANDDMYVEAVAALTVLVQELGTDGKPTEKTSWIDEIKDKAIILKIYEEYLIDYENSLYEDAASDAKA